MPKNTVAQTFVEYRERLLKFIRSRVRAFEDAEDIVQEVFYNFARANDLANPVEQTAAWLYRAARNRIIDHYKKKKDILFSVFADDDDGDDDDISDIIDILATDEATPETEMLRSFMWDAVKNALDELPQAQRDIFIQTEFEGLSVKEIAEKTGVPVNTLLSRKHYAVKRLREKLSEIYADMTGG
ncbi:MAG: sigma-70 family RNA polymerase sigma factor [Treponema sp.]|jgi:RNA polymerase sigma factor (sigma-70 family)|nr:sigma-70 family RNA polymerase sigma factor [Treponema sp.]